MWDARHKPHVKSHTTTNQKSMSIFACELLVWYCFMGSARQPRQDSWTHDCASKATRWPIAPHRITPQSEQLVYLIYLFDSNEHISLGTRCSDVCNVLPKQPIRVTSDRRRYMGCKAGRQSPLLPWPRSGPCSLEYYLRFGEFLTRPVCKLVYQIREFGRDTKSQAPRASLHDLCCAPHNVRTTWGYGRITGCAYNAVLINDCIKSMFVSRRVRGWREFARARSRSYSKRGICGATQHEYTNAIYSICTTYTLCCLVKTWIYMNLCMIEVRIWSYIGIGW